MSVVVDKADIKVLKGFPEDKVWNVVISFPEAVEGLIHKSSVRGPLDYLLYKIQSWTDEPVDLNELRLVGYNENTNEYKIVKGDDEDVPEGVQYDLLARAREVMSEAHETLSSR